MDNLPFGSVISYDEIGGHVVVLMVVASNTGVCLVELPWRYAGEITEFAGDDWVVIREGPENEETT